MFASFTLAAQDEYRCRRASQIMLRRDCGLSHGGQPAALRLPDGKVRIFSKDVDGNLVERRKNADAWEDSWSGFSRTMNMTRGLAVLSLNQHEVDLRIYARNDHGRLAELSMSAAGLTGWKSLGGDVASAPTPVWLTREKGLRVYARDSKNELMSKTWLPESTWKDWVNLGGGQFTGDPSAIYIEDTGDVAIYARNKAGEVMELVEFGDGTVRSWRPLGAERIVGSPSALYMGRERVRLYARGVHNELVELAGSVSDWGAPSWRKLGLNITGTPSAILGPDGYNVHGVRVYAYTETGDLMEKAVGDAAGDVGVGNLGRGHCKS
jgi:hypothetical protein